MNRSVTPDMLPESAIERTERDEELAVAVMTLPIKLRECILLYSFEDMSTVEIAQTLHTLPRRIQRDKWQTDRRHVPLKRI